MDIGMLIKIAGICILTVIGSVSVMIFKGKQDNPVEEISEFLIEEITGVDIDLTPTSKEE